MVKEKKEMTNAEMIRKMTDEELYTFLNKRGFCPYTDGCKYHHGCKKCLKKYLGKESEK